MSNPNHSKSNAAPSLSQKYDECLDRAFRIPVFLSTTNILNNKQRQFQNRLITEIENALLFPRTLPVSEQYPETFFTVYGDWFYPVMDSWQSTFDAFWWRSNKRM